MTDISFSNGLNLPLRLGDYNNDGYPDIILVTKKNGNRFIRILQSEECDGSCSGYATEANRRTFKLVDKNLANFELKGKTPVGATFMDINNNVNVF